METKEGQMIEKMAIECEKGVRYQWMAVFSYFDVFSQQFLSFTFKLIYSAGHMGHIWSK